MINNAVENHFAEPISDEVFHRMVKDLWTKIERSNVATEAKWVISKYPFVFYALLASEDYNKRSFRKGFEEHHERDTDTYISYKVYQYLFDSYDYEAFDNLRNGSIWNYILMTSRQSVYSIQDIHEEFSTMLAPTLAGNLTFHNVILNDFKSSIELPPYEVSGEWNINNPASDLDEFLSVNPLTKQFISHGPWRPRFELEHAYLCYLQTSLLEVSASTYVSKSEASQQFQRKMLEYYGEEGLYSMENIQSHQCSEDDQNLIDAARLFLLWTKAGEVFDTAKGIEYGSPITLGSFIADFSDLALGKSFDYKEALEHYEGMEHSKTNIVKHFSCFTFRLGGTIGPR